MSQISYCFTNTRMDLLRYRCTVTNRVVYPFAWEQKFAGKEGGERKGALVWRFLKNEIGGLFLSWCAGRALRKGHWLFCVEVSAEVRRALHEEGWEGVGFWGLGKNYISDRSRFLEKSELLRKKQQFMFHAMYFVQMALMRQYVISGSNAQLKDIYNEQSSETGVV